MLSRSSRSPVRISACGSPLLALLALLVAVPLSVDAGQPLATEDAAVVTPKTCQLEAWTVTTHDSREYWALPACNFTGNLELAAGGARVHSDADEPSSVIALQAKTVLLPRDNRSWSLGVVGGGMRDTAAPHGSSAFQTFYAKGLASWYPRDDVEIDFNLGAANAHGSGTFALAGAAIQYSIVSKLQLLAEVFRDEPGPSKYQVGARWIVVKDRFEAYIGYENLFQGPSDGWSATVGIRLQTPKFLP
jgi:hypothetical protein